MKIMKPAWQRIAWKFGGRMSGGWASGAGKTITVSAVSGILPVSHGQVVFMDEDITRVESFHRVEMGQVTLGHY